VNSQSDRLCELLADRALGAVTADEELELEALLAAGQRVDGLPFEMTAAVLELSMLRATDMTPMPSTVLVRIEASGAAWAAVTSQVVRPRRTSGRIWRATVVGTPWMAAAACLVLAGLAWRRASGADPIAVTEKDPNKTVVQVAAWDGGPGKSVHGRLCWSEDQQCGYLKLQGLPPNDCEHQYQLWIIDQRGTGERISGGTFNCTGSGECTVPFRPALHVQDAQEFAITMEKPGGTMMSDMSRKVAIGRCSKSKQ
jgi:anti-sigma-K factor RskA